MESSDVDTKSLSRRSERGATLTGYALTMAVMVVVGLGSMSALERNSETFLEDTGTAIGEPRPSAEVAAQTGQLASLPAGLNYSNSNGQLSNPSNPNANGSTTTTPTTAPPTTPAAPTASATGSSSSAPNPSGSSNVAIQASYQAGDDLNASGGSPFQSDTDLNVFNEGKVTLTSPWVVPGTNPAITLNAGESVCGYYVHYAPSSSNATITNTTVTFPGEVLSAIGSNDGLDDTDAWMDGGVPNSPSYRGSRSLENGEAPSVTGNSITYGQLYAVNGNQDDTRVFTRC